MGTRQIDLGPVRHRPQVCRRHRLDRSNRRTQFDEESRPVRKQSGAALFEQLVSGLRTRQGKDRLTSPRPMRPGGRELPEQLNPPAAICIGLEREAGGELDAASNAR
ncbi:hypothetical protein D3C84_611710 [compost metagenome]